MPRTMERTAMSDAGAMRPYEDLLDYLRRYMRERPETAAIVCLGIGFVLGWKLKPW